MNVTTTSCTPAVTCTGILAKRTDEIVALVGDTNQHGMEGVRFYTKVKTITARWPEGATEDSAFIIPTMS